MEVETVQPVRQIIRFSFWLLNGLFASIILQSCNYWWDISTFSECFYTHTSIDLSVWWILSVDMLGVVKLGSNSLPLGGLVALAREMRRLHSPSLLFYWFKWPMSHYLPSTKYKNQTNHHLIKLGNFRPKKTFFNLFSLTNTFITLKTIFKFKTPLLKKNTRSSWKKIFVNSHHLILKLKLFSSNKTY